MGGLFSRVWSMLFDNSERKIVLIGLNNAGKTTTLYKLQVGEAVATVPTVGSNVEEVMFRNIKFVVWDLGGQDALRPSWSAYFMGTDAVIMVVDSTDRQRISVVRRELARILASEDLRNAVILVFANKQDVDGAMTAAEIASSLSLHDITDHEWQIQACCALTGDGLVPGMEWVADRVRSRRRSSATAAAAPAATSAAAGAAGPSASSS